MQKTKYFFLIAILALLMGFGVGQVRAEEPNLVEGGEAQAPILLFENDEQLDLFIQEVEKADPQKVDSQGTAEGAIAGCIPHERRTPRLRPGQTAVYGFVTSGGCGTIKVTLVPGACVRAQLVGRPAGGEVCIPPWQTRTVGAWLPAGAPFYLYIKNSYYRTAEIIAFTSKH